MPWTKQFDPQVAIGRAMEVFWQLGYEAASLNDLLQAMGIQKGSFYDTFGSKHELYLRALESYGTERLDAIVEMTAGKDPKKAIAQLMSLVKSESLGAEGNRSCFALNCILERAHNDPEALEIAHRTLRRHEGIFAGLIKRGQEAGTIPDSVDAKRVSKVLVGLSMAMRVYGKAQAPASTINALYWQALNALEG